MPRQWQTACWRFDLIAGVPGVTIKLPAVMEMLDDQMVLEGDGANL